MFWRDDLMKRVLAISCGLNNPKKEYGSISKKNLYLNYGLLGLCTILNDRGYNVKQFQGEFLSPSELIDEINKTEYQLNSLNLPVIISIISFLSLGWCNEISKIIKQNYGIKIIVGGKYVVDGNVMWLREKLPFVDYFIEGTGEEKIEDVLIEGKCRNLDNETRYYDRLDFSLLNNYKKYNPCIELARGCGRGCTYCADGFRGMSSVKDADKLIDELHFIYKTYDYEDFNLYFQMATFQVNDQWIEVYKKRMWEFPKIFYWRCTSRIDAVCAEELPRLAQIGLKVIDLGLESASPTQLIAMKKTNNPNEYLKSAEALLRTAYNCGIWVKLNILLTAGESLTSISETIDWLKSNRKYIKGVSTNIETIYGPSNPLANDLISFGATVTDPCGLENNGFSYLNLSNDIDFSLAKKIAIKLSQKMMTAKDYYDLKKFGYFPRDYLMNQFFNDLKKIDPRNLPFTIESC